jgi:lysophospholipase L1-like esterase
MIFGSHSAWKWVTVSYLIVLHVVSAVFIVTDFIPKVKANMGLGVTVELTPNPHVPNMIRYHQWMDDSVPDMAAIFLGDSITQGLATAAIAPYAVNYGIGGENTTQFIDAIPTYRSLERSSVIFLEIGINDIIEQGRKIGLNDRYQKIMKILPNKIPLVWSAVMPIKRRGILLSDIIDANNMIKALCEKRGNCIYVDTWKFLTDMKGQMINHLFLDDGAHLSSEGYKAWIAALKQAMQLAIVGTNTSEKNGVSSVWTSHL